MSVHIVDDEQRGDPAAPSALRVARAARLLCRSSDDAPRHRRRRSASRIGPPRSPHTRRICELGYLVLLRNRR